MAAVALLLGSISYLWLRPDFYTLDGEAHQWRQYQGQWVLVNYFAQWCAPCLREIPELNHFYHNQSRDNIQLFAVSFDRKSPQQLKAIAQQHNIEFPLLAQEPAPAMLNRRPDALPATFLISPEGEVVKQLLGEQTQESLKQTIAAFEEKRRK